MYRRSTFSCCVKKIRRVAEVIPKHFGRLSTRPCLTHPFLIRPLIWKGQDLPQTSNGSCALTGWLSLRIADRQYLPSGSDRHLMLKTSSNSLTVGLENETLCLRNIFKGYHVSRQTFLHTMQKGFQMRYCVA